MKALATKESVVIDEWVGCYRGGWKGVIVDEAFSHPAKVAFNLAKRIYEHAIDCGWIHPDDVVIDPFGGIGGCAFHGLMNGMHVVTCELEEKFANLSKQNRELWRKQYTGLPGFNADNWIILRGDSRKLASVIQEAGLSVSSPPYAGYDDHGGQATAAERDRRRLERLRPDLSGRFDTCFKGSEEYGQSEGQLGAMKEGDLTCVISSPPYARSLMPDMNDPEKYAASEARYRENHPEHKRPKGAAMIYGNTSGNLGHIPEGDLSLAVSSPPYAVVSPEKSSRSVDYAKQYETYRSQGGGASFEKFVATQELHSQGYGSSDGQLSQLSGEGFSAAISSPPYESSEVASACKSQNPEGRQATYHRSHGFNGFGESKGQLGIEKGDTFWSASRTILEQLYSVLTPGAHAIFIVKSFVRDKKIVDFPGQWAQLCEAVGFKLIHDHHAMLTEHSGTQGGMFGEDKEHKVKRISFFRRLQEKKSPETAIEYENVLCFERP